MTPTAAGFAATAAMVAVAGLVGVAAGRWWNRRDWATNRADTAVLKHALARQERKVRYLQEQVTEAVRIIDDLTDARLADAAGVEPFPNRVDVPPHTRRALMEAREKPLEN